MADERPKGRETASTAGSHALAGQSATPPSTTRTAGPNAMRSADDKEPSPGADDLDAREARQAGRQRKAPGPARDTTTRPATANVTDGPPATDPE